LPPPNSTPVRPWKVFWPNATKIIISEKCTERTILPRQPYPAQGNAVEILNPHISNLLDETIRNTVVPPYNVTLIDTLRGKLVPQGQRDIAYLAYLHLLAFISPA
jgi:hypothetical protein